MTAPFRPDLPFGTTPRLPGSLTGRLPYSGPIPSPYTAAGWEEERKRRLREAIAMGLPIRDVTQMQLPEMRIEAPRPALPQLANVLARETRPELEGTRSVPTSPTERYSLGGVLADIAAQPIAALQSTAGTLGEGIQRTLGFEEAARRTRERTAAMNEALAPSTGPGLASRLASSFVTEAAPFIAATPTIPVGATSLQRALQTAKGLGASAGLTALQSQAAEGSTVKALSELTGYQPLQRLAASPFKTAADIALDVGFNVAPEIIGGALRGTRTAARGAEPGVLPAAGAVTRQVGRNIAEAPRAAAELALAVPAVALLTKTGRAAIGGAAGVAAGETPEERLALGLTGATGAALAPSVIRRLARPSDVPITDEMTKRLLSVWQRANPKVEALAREYVGGELPRTLNRATTLDKPFAARIAEWYDSAVSNPNDPEVQAAYRAFADETRRQYEFLRSKGITFEFVDTDPYKTSAEMMRDVADNNRLKVLKTEAGMHPLLTEEENDMFRAVHDFFGHAKEGHQFGQLGEENAYRVHSAMYSPEARRVMATETRGQNSWVNNQPANKVKPGSVYAEQKVALMPEEFMGEYPIERTTPEVVTNVEMQSLETPGLTDAQVKSLRGINRTLGRAAFIRKVVEPIVKSEGLPVSVAKGLGSWMANEDAGAITEAARLTFSQMSPMAIQRVLARVSQAARQMGLFFAVPNPSGEYVSVTLDFGRALREPDYRAAIERLMALDKGRSFGGTTMVKLDPAKVQIVLNKGVDEQGAERLLTLARQALPQYDTKGVIQRVETVEAGDSASLDNAFLEYFNRIGYLTPEQAQAQQRAVTAYGQLAQAGPIRRALAAGPAGIVEGLRGVADDALRRLAKTAPEYPPLAAGREGVGDVGAGAEAVGRGGAEPPAGAMGGGTAYQDTRGKVYEATGIIPEALRFAARPSVAPAVGAVVGAGAAEEDRFGGAMAGAAVGAGVSGAVGGVRALAAARQQLRAAGLPETLANAYAYAKRGIDFTGAGERTLGRRLRGDWRSIVQRGIDNYADAQRALDRLAGRAEAAGLAPEASVGTALNEALSSDVTAARALRHGLGVERGGIIDPLTKEVIGEPLEDVFKPLGGNPAKNEQALTYAVALRNIGRYDAAVAAGDANPLRVYGGDMARMEADRAIVDGFGQKPEFVEFANRLEQYFANLTEYAVRSGLWTPEVARAIRESDTFYVPFKRLIEAHTGMGPGPMRGGATPGRVGPGVQRFRGSDLMIGNPAVTIAEYTQALIRRADMYRVGNALIESVNALGEAGQPLLTKINASDPMARALGVAEAEGAYRALGLGEEEARQMGDLFMRLNKDNPVIYRNTPAGKEYYLVNDPALWDAVQSINPQDPEALNALVTVFGPLKRYATLFATGMSPQFWFGTNIPRDILTAAAQNPNITMVDVGVGFLEGLKSIVGRSQMVEQLSRGGMGQVSQFGGDVDVRSLARQIAPTTIGEAAGAAVGQGVTLPLRALERVGRGTELPMRIAAARAAQRQAAEAGVSEAGQRALATRAGAAATVDFRRRAGTAFQRFLERTVPYFGAAKKGGVWFARAARNNPKTVGAAAGVITLGTVWEYLLSDDKDRAEFVDRPAGERARYLHLGETRVALPQEYAVLASAVRMGLAQVKQDDPFVYDQFKAAMLNMLPPIYSDVAKGDPIALMPFPVGRELIELSRNREEFTGRSIVTPGMERQLPAARRRDTTAPTFDVMAAAARQMGIEEASPVQAEFLTRGMFGRFTPAVTAVTDIAARPIAGREAQPQVPLPFARQPLNPITGFQSRPVTRGQSEQEFYDLRNEVQQAQATYNALKRDRAEARQRGDTATVNRTTADAERLAAANPVFKAVFEDRNTKRISGFLKTADDKLEKLQAKREQAVSAFANGRITGARARQVIDSLDTERAKLLREGYTRLSRRVPR